MKRILINCSYSDELRVALVDGAKLFDNVISNAYANNTFSSNSGQKWVLIDLNMSVELGALTIQAR